MNTKHRRPRGLDADATLRWHGWTVTESGCWEWAGPLDGNGYGRIRFNGPKIHAHRLAYETWVGPIPAGLVIRHHCDNPRCIRPGHLTTGTLADNVRDMDVRGRRTVLRGQQHGNSKLTAADVRDMREQHAAGIPGRELADRFGVSEATVSLVVNRKRWIA